MVSAYCPSEQPLSAVSGISLGQLLRDHAVESVDLLKIDCEGGEYAILESTPADVFNRVRNIVFEYHDIDGTWAKLESVKQRLRREGYALHMGPGLCRLRDREVIRGFGTYSLLLENQERMPAERDPGLLDGYHKPAWGIWRISSGASTAAGDQRMRISIRRIGKRPSIRSCAKI